MDLMPENPIVEQKKTSKFTIWLVVVVILIILLIIAAIGIWMYSKSLQTAQFKVVIDGINNQQLAKSNGSFLINNDKVYISIEDICDQVAYRYYSGEYKKFEEDKTKGYVTNQKEVVSFASGSKEIIKYPAEGESLGQSFELEEEISMQGNKLYINAEGFSRMFNSTISYDSNNNTINISTLPYLTTYYEKNILGASLEESNFEDSIKFNNEKALLRGLIIVKDEEKEKYGVSKINDDGKTTEEILQPRFEQIEYMEGSDDFVVKTNENKVGIYGNNGITKVSPSYDSIEVIDKNIGLYLATIDNKPSVINNRGKIIVYPDYDSIGLDSGAYQDKNITNRYLLFGNCIPVNLGKKWGLIDKNGTKIVELKYDGIGYLENVSTGQKNSNGIVIIPEMQGIVIAQENKDEATGAIVKKYGIINATTGKLMVSISLDSAYSTTTENVTTYYVTIQDRVIDIVNWWHNQMAETGKSTNGITENDLPEQQNGNTSNSNDEVPDEQTQEDNN